jgi:hypothetical protein
MWLSGNAGLKIVCLRITEHVQDILLGYTLPICTLIRISGHNVVFTSFILFTIFLMIR